MLIWTKPFQNPFFMMIYITRNKSDIINADSHQLGSDVWNKPEAQEVHTLYSVTQWIRYRHLILNKFKIVINWLINILSCKLDFVMN